MTDTPTIRPRLKPFELFVQAYALTFGNLESLIRFSWLGVLVIAVAGRLLAGDAPQIETEADAENLPPGLFAVFALLALCVGLLHAMVAVAWHRAILLGEHHRDRRIYLHLSAREALYGLIGIFFGMILFMGTSTALVMLQSSGGNLMSVTLGMVLGPGIALFVFSRSMFVLPGVALGRGSDIGASWRATQGNGLRAAATLLLVMAPVGAIELSLLLLVQSFAERDLGIVAGLLVSFITMTVMIVMVSTIVAAISLMYARLVDPKLLENDRFA